jgi:hypothetical protein
MWKLNGSCKLQRNVDTKSPLIVQGAFFLLFVVMIAVLAAKMMMPFVMRLRVNYTEAKHG